MSGSIEMDGSDYAETMYELEQLRTDNAALRTRAEAAERRVEEMRQFIDKIPGMRKRVWDYGDGLCHCGKECGRFDIYEVPDGAVPMWWLKEQLALLAAPTAGRTDGERLDWLEKEQGDVYLTNNGERIVAGMPKRAGVYRGKTIRAAIDAAMEPPAKGATPE